MTEHPPKPRLALTIGVIGHRPNRLPQAQEARLKSEIAKVLDEIAAGADAAHKTYAAFFSSLPPSFSLVTGLAEGADTLAAEVALDRAARGFTLAAALPFATEEFEKDFKSDNARKKLHELVACAKSCLELPGERSRPEDSKQEGARKESRSYEATGLTVLSQADILLAIWDGGASRGRGGTTEMLNVAARQGIPVIHIHVNDEKSSAGSRDAVATCLRWSGLAEFPASANAIEDAPHRMLSKDLLERLVDRLICPPTGLEERKALSDYLGEGSRRFHFRSEYLLLLRLSGRRLRFEDLKSTEPFTLAARLTAFSDPVRGGDVSAIATAFGWADAIGLHFAQAFRSAFVSNFILASLAVMLAAFAIPFPEQKVPLVICEIGCIVLIVANTNFGRRRRWHRRWFEAREVAERLRAVLLHWMLGIRPATFFAIQEPTWTGWYTRAILREQGLRAGWRPSEWVATARFAMIDLLRNQCAYHESNARRMEHLEHRLEKIGLWLFGGTIVIAVLSLGVGIFDPHSEKLPLLLSKALLFLSIVLPAAATAAYGIRIFGDFEGICRRSQRTHATLDRLIAAIQNEKSDLAALRYHAAAAADTMLGDVDSWRLATENHNLAFPH